MRATFHAWTRQMSTLAVGATLFVLLNATAVAQTWTGAANDTKWSTAGNWNPSVPGMGGNVFIDDNGSHPEVLLDVDAVVGSLTMTRYAFLRYISSAPGARNFSVQGTTTINRTTSYPTGVDVQSGADFRLGTLSNLSKGVLANCYLSVYDKDGAASRLPTRIGFRNADVITNKAFVFLEGIDAAIVDEDTGQNAFRNLAANTNQFYVGSSVQTTFPGNFANTGDIYVYDNLAAPTAKLTVNGTFTNSGKDGYLYLNTGGDMLVTGDFNNNGNNDYNGGVFITARGAEPSPVTPSKMIIQGNLRNASKSFISVDGRTAPARLFVNGNLTNSGFISLKGLGSLEVAGTITMDGGDIVMQAATTGFETFKMTAERIDLAAGTRFGARGTLFADLVDSGIFSPGASPGLVTINGDVTFTNTAELQFEIGGEAPGTQYDRLEQVTRATDTGTVLGGRLSVTVVDGFQVNNSHTFAIINSDRPLTGAFTNVPSGGRISTSDGSGNFQVSYAGQNAVTLSAFQAGPLPLQLSAAFSRKTHGALGSFDIPLPLTGTPGLECRSSGGDHAIVFTFTNNVVSGSVSVTSGIGTVLGNPTFAGNTMTVNLTGVADVQQIAVTISDVTDAFGQVLPSTSTVNMNLLMGDTNGNKSVTSTDVSETKSQSGVPVTNANFRRDVTPNGSINASDLGLVKSRTGAMLP